jgi:hypothetical protein
MTRANYIHQTAAPQLCAQRLQNQDTFEVSGVYFEPVRSKFTPPQFTQLADYQRYKIISLPN